MNKLVYIFLFIVGLFVVAYFLNNLYQRKEIKLQSEINILREQNKYLSLTADSLKKTIKKEATSIVESVITQKKDFTETDKTLQQRLKQLDKKYADSIAIYRFLIDSDIKFWSKLLPSKGCN